MTAVTTAALALALALAACGGGNDGSPAASGTPTPTPTATATTPPPAASPEAERLRAAAKKTLAACPCAVEVSGSASSDEGFYRGAFTGVYDPATQSTELRDTDSPLRVRIVDGRTFVQTEGLWLELDFAGYPAKPLSVLSTMPLIDPRIGFAFADSVSFIDPTANHKDRRGTRFEAEFDTKVAASKAGPWADLVGRMFHMPLLYDDVVFGKGGGFAAVDVAAEAPDGSYTFSTALTVTKTGVRAPAVRVPPGARKVDVATLKL